MNLKSIGEFGFIKRVSQGCLIRPDTIVKAIGDDAAAFRTRPDMLALLTTDLLIERGGHGRGGQGSFREHCHTR
jgi:thiamine-monophosphate kinase